MVDKETAKIIEEIKATYGEDWYTAVVYELMRLNTLCKLALHGPGDLDRYHRLRRFVCRAVKETK